MTNGGILQSSTSIIVESRSPVTRVTSGLDRWCRKIRKSIRVLSDLRLLVAKRRRQGFYAWDGYITQ